MDASVEVIRTYGAAADDLTLLQADGWIDEGSRAVSLELAIHSFSGRQV